MVGSHTGEPRKPVRLAGRDDRYDFWWSLGGEVMTAKPRAKYERYYEDQPASAICINSDCYNFLSTGNATGVIVTYPEGAGPSRPLTGWLCTGCAKLLL